MNYNTIKYLKRKIAKATIDFTSYNTIDSAFTFDAANIDETADTITITGHPYNTGDLVSPILTATTGVTATAPAIGTAYYVIYVDKNTISLATSLANAKAGTVTALTAGGAVDVFLQRNCFGPIGTGLVVPKGALVDRVSIRVITACKSWDGAWGAGNEDDATIALMLLGAGDVLAAVVLDSGTLFSATGAKGTIIGSPILGADAAHDTAIEVAALQAASSLVMTSDANLTVTVAVDPVGTGKFEIYVDYLI